MKYCNHCNKTKSTTEFSYRWAASGNRVLVSYCKSCLKIRAVDWQNKNRCLYRAYQNKYTRDLRAQVKEERLDDLT